MNHRKRPWEEEWLAVKGGELGQGGQGKSFLVIRRGGEATPCVLKRLLNNNSPERRMRMYREVASLQTLDCAGVPRYVSGNTAAWKDEVPLYFVQEYIEGKTLEQHVAASPLGAAAAIAMLESLLTTLDACHANDVVHRDLKPDNVVLRADDPRNPVLIDFGLSFNLTDDSADMSTESQQHLGSKFLILPELNTAESNKRDPRSDLTAAIGLVLFALSHRKPQMLMDADHRKPHQREPAAEVLRTLDNRYRQLFTKLFDRAFELAIDYRWQSISAIKQLLASQHDDVSLIDDETKLQVALRRFSDDPENSRRTDARKNIGSLQSLVLRTINDRAKKMGPDFVVSQSHYPIDWTTYSQVLIYKIVSIIRDEALFGADYRVRVTSTEIILDAKDDRELWEELFRSNLNISYDGDAIADRLNAYLSAGLVRKLA